MKKIQQYRLWCLGLALLSVLIYCLVPIGEVGGTWLDCIDFFLDVISWFGIGVAGLECQDWFILSAPLWTLVSILLLLFGVDDRLSSRCQRGMMLTAGILAALAFVAFVVAAAMGSSVVAALPSLPLLLMAGLALRAAWLPVSDEEAVMRRAEALEKDCRHGGKTFPVGGVHPASNKWSRAEAVEPLALPDTVQIPLSQHIGAPATAKVAKGDTVKVGQLIAEASSFMSANIHAPISGTVLSVEPQPNGQGIRIPMITIRREGDEWMEGIDRSTELVRECTLTPKEILDKIREAGIVGMGGATFPTHVKLSVPAGKKAEWLIINGVECEPYLTSDHRTMLERGEEMLVGVTILMRALGVKEATIGVENNKPDAIDHLRALAARYPGIKIQPLKVRYPQGGEKQLIAAITGRQVPPPPGLPIDVGVVVCNASTAQAVYEAVQKNKPLIERIVTVTGKRVEHPRNLRVRFGTPIAQVLEAAGTRPESDEKILNGGPMMGRAMANLSAPVLKGCSGLTVLSGPEALRGMESACIRCGKCVNACPMGLEPFLLSKLARRKDWERSEHERVVDCIECGSCQFTCPAEIPLLDFIRQGKQRVMGIIRTRAAASTKK